MRHRMKCNKNKIDYIKDICNGIENGHCQANAIKQTSGVADW